MKPPIQHIDQSNLSTGAVKKIFLTVFVSFTITKESNVNIF